ncbi:hypothetical protein BDZ45DRAFT_343497 [Acephala macrosclerotiorum]|nr:hypothetical protein BDZ45DRAFT_343497 [Acephala macrosclerotiorum]
MFNSMRPHASSSHASSEPLNEATMSHPASPRQPPDHLPTDRSAVDEHELVRPALNSDIFDEQNTQPQEDENYDNDIEDGNQPQQEVKEDVAAALMTGKVGDTHLSSGKDENLGLAPCDPPPKPSEDKLGSYGDSWKDDEFNNNSESDDDDRRLNPTKRKRLSSSNNGPKQKKRKHHLEQKSTHQHRPRSKLHQHYWKSHSSPDQGSRVAVASSGEGQFPSPVPSAPQTMDTEMPRDCSNLGGSSGDLLSTLTEVTFRPYSQHCCSFSAVVQDGYDEQGVSFSQLAQLIKSIGHVGKINDFKIKPLQQHSFLVTGFSRYTSSQLSSSGMILSTAAEANLIPNDAPSTILQHGRAVDTETVAQRGSEPASSDDGDGLSDSHPDPSSDDDSCSSEDGQKRSNTRMNVPWEDIDEQRLLAYKKEGQSWEWIFGKFPGRTRPAIRTRWNMIRPRGD